MSLFFLLKLYGDYSSDENAMKRNAVFVFRGHGNDWSKQLACGLTKYLNIRKGKSLSLETLSLLASPQQGSLMCYKLQILIQFNQTIFLSNSAKQHLWMRNLICSDKRKLSLFFTKNIFIQRCLLLTISICMIMSLSVYN